MSEDKDSKQKEYTEDELKKFVPLYIEGLIEKGMYEINRYGDVKSLTRNKLMSKKINRGGYIEYSLSKSKNNPDRAYVLAHRLVATMFIENPNNYKIVDHIDRNKKNNCVTNLRWCTYSENTFNTSNLNSERISNFYYEMVDENGQIIKRISIKDVDKEDIYSSNVIRKAIKTNTKYKGYFWRRINLKTEEYINKYKIKLEKEEWKLWEKGEYSIECCSSGLFRFNDNNNEITPGSIQTKETGNYRRISLKGKGGTRKSFTCHSIIFECFSGETLKDGEVIDHINTDPGDNRFENLRKCTEKENMNNPLTKEKFFKKVCRYTLLGEFKKKYNSIKEVEDFNSSISSCCNKKSNRTIYKDSFWCYFGDESKIIDDVNSSIYKYKTLNDKTPENITKVGYTKERVDKYPKWRDIKNCILTGQPHPKTGYYYSLGLKNWETGEQIIPDVTPKLKEENQK